MRNTRTTRTADVNAGAAAMQETAVNKMEESVTPEITKKEQEFFGSIILDLDARAANDKIFRLIAVRLAKSYYKRPKLSEAVKRTIRSRDFILSALANAGFNNMDFLKCVECVVNTFQAGKENNTLDALQNIKGISKYAKNRAIEIVSEHTGGKRTNILTTGGSLA